MQIELQEFQHFSQEKRSIYLAWVLKDEIGSFIKLVLTKVEFSSLPNYLLYIFLYKKFCKNIFIMTSMFNQDL